MAGIKSSNRKPRKYAQNVHAPLFFIRGGKHFTNFGDLHSKRRRITHPVIMMMISTVNLTWNTNTHTPDWEMMRADYLGRTSSAWVVREGIWIRVGLASFYLLPFLTNPPPVPPATAALGRRLFSSIEPDQLRGSKQSGEGGITIAQASHCHLSAWIWMYYSTALLRDNMSSLLHPPPGPSTLPVYISRTYNVERSANSDIM